MARIADAGGLPGAAAGSAVLFLLAWVLEAPLWAAAAAAIASYAGIALLFGWQHTPRRIDPDERHASTTAALLHVVTLHRLADRIDKDDVRQRVNRIAESAERAVRAMREDEDEDTARIFVDQVLDPVVALLTEYVRLSSRGLVSAADAIERTESWDFPLIEQAIDDIYERLHRRHVIDLATNGEMLGLNLERIADAIARRARR